MASVITIVDGALRAAGIPIVGVSMGDPADRSTWAVQFDPSATGPQRTQAATILATVAVDATALHVQDTKDAQAAVDAISLFEKALVLVLIDEINIVRAALPAPLGPRTPAQALAAIRAKAATL